MVKIGKRNVMLIGLILLVLIGGGGYYATILRSAKEKEAEIAKIPDDQKSEEQLLTVLEKTEKPKDKAEIYRHLANRLANTKGGEQKALDYAKKAAEVDPSAETWGHVGSAASMTEDWQTAYDAYKKARDLSYKDDDQRGDYVYYSQLMSEAEEQINAKK